MPHRKKFDTQQLAALKGIYSWRETTARLADESPGSVCPLSYDLIMMLYCHSVFHHFDENDDLNI